MVRLNDHNHLEHDIYKRLLLKTTRPTQEKFLHIGRVAILQFGSPFQGLPVRL